MCWPHAGGLPAAGTLRSISPRAGRTPASRHGYSVLQLDPSPRPGRGEGEDGFPQGNVEVALSAVKLLPGPASASLVPAGVCLDEWDLLRRQTEKQVEAPSVVLLLTWVLE